MCLRFDHFLRCICISRKLIYVYMKEAVKVIIKYINIEYDNL